MANKSKTNKPNKKEEKNPTSGLKTYIFLASVVIVGLISVYAYNISGSVPELPKLDMNKWWGPLPMDSKQDVSIKPFKIEFSDVVINDLKERLMHTRPFVPPLEDVGFQYGFNSNFLKRVLDYWKNSYNFKDREQFLNQYNHFKTNIQGLEIHFMHVKPQTPEGVQTVPLLLLHGWPGSIREFYEMVPKLTTPRQYNFVFEVIVPSLPGYGFSEGAVRPGLNALEIAVVMNNLMQRLGHQKYYVQGGDYGHFIGANLATIFPDRILGLHTNMPMVSSNSMVIVKTVIGAYFPSLIVEPGLESRMYPWLEKFFNTIEETGYVHIQATKPDTVGIALSDSPAGLAAYILEKFSTWTNPEYKKAGDGGLLNKFALTHLLDNIMIYWTTNSITTSMRLYAETFSKSYMAYNLDSIPTPVPTWGLKMKHELGFQPDTILKHKFTNYIHSTIVEDGGHFAAFEMPDLVADDVFEAVRTFREFHSRSEGNIAKTIYEFTVKDINGKEVKLEKYKGHVLIIVNVASQCGLTSTNYQQLNELHEKYAQSKGLRILAFPCNQFSSQEPGSSKEILTFTKEKGVKFDLFEKVDVNGDNAHPLWQFLKRTQAGTLGDFIKWNFSKFIIDKNGVPVERLGPNVDPLDLVPLLEKYW